MSLANGANSFANAVYTYDAIGRIATTGNNSDTVTYTYAPGTNRIASTGWQTAEVNTTNTYDQFKRLTNIAVNGGNVYGYTLNDKNQRTSATLANGKNWTFEYDDLGQLTGAVFKFNELAEKTLNYGYDQIGNRTTATENSVVTNYTSNIINQYTAINQTLPTYDADGNMLTNGDWSYTWNGENRLTKAENSVSGVRIEADYDYMGRRIFKKIYNNNTLTTHRKFAYDGFKLIAEFDALNNDALIANYLWQVPGMDVPLMRSANGVNDYYIVDGNKNVIELRNSSGAVTKSYAYSPFGILENPIAGDENPFQFSSEYADPETGLVYYNYRYYSPTLGRWLNPDPIEEMGGLNLYAMLRNSTVMFFDVRGNFSGGELLDYIWEKISNSTIEGLEIIEEYVINLPISYVIGEDYGSVWSNMLYPNSWANGLTGGYATKIINNEMAGIHARQKADGLKPNANGCHSWHMETNTMLVRKLGICGIPLIFIAGIIHETPLDYESFMSEQKYQGTVNHFLDSTGDIFSNVLGIAYGVLPLPQEWSGVIGSNIWGPSDPDPILQNGKAKTKVPYIKQTNPSPSNAW